MHKQKRGGKTDHNPEKKNEVSSSCCSKVSETSYKKKKLKKTRRPHRFDFVGEQTKVGAADRPAELLVRIDTLTHCRDERHERHKSAKKLTQSDNVLIGHQHLDVVAVNVNRASVVAQQLRR